MMWSIVVLDQAGIEQRSSTDALLLAEGASEKLFGSLATGRVEHTNVYRVRTTLFAQVKLLSHSSCHLKGGSVTHVEASVLKRCKWRQRLFRVKRMGRVVMNRVFECIMERFLYVHPFAVLVLVMPFFANMHCFFRNMNQPTARESKAKGLPRQNGRGRGLLQVELQSSRGGSRSKGRHVCCSVRHRVSFVDLQSNGIMVSARWRGYMDIQGACKRKSNSLLAELSEHEIGETRAMSSW